MSPLLDVMSKVLVLLLLGLPSGKASNQSDVRPTALISCQSHPTPVFCCLGPVLHPIDKRVLHPKCFVVADTRTVAAPVLEIAVRPLSTVRMSPCFCFLRHCRLHFSWTWHVIAGPMLFSVLCQVTRLSERLHCR